MNEAAVMFRDANDPVPFGKTFVQSDAFRALFREGMGLVEETAAYLDGPGREESRKLARRKRRHGNQPGTARNSRMPRL